MIRPSHVQNRPMNRISEKLPMPGGYFDLVLRHFANTPKATEALLEGTNFSLAQLSKPDVEITLGQGLRLLRNGNTAFAPGWALDLGRALQPSAHGPLGIAVICAPTIRDSFEVIQRACHLRHPAYRAMVKEQGDELRLELHECLALYEDERLPLIETFLLSFQGFVEAVLGRSMSEGRFEIATAAPSYANLYVDYFHAEVRFDQLQSAIVIPAQWGKLRCPFADSSMFAAASSKLDALTLKFDRMDYTAAHVEHLMMSGSDAGLSLTEVADRLGISERTLVRRLHDAGTTYRDLRDAHRRRRAEELLRDGTVTVAELGYRLGYEDAANFNRACRRWFGAAPGKLRQKPAGGR